jgi:hypothetical protein
MTYLVCFKEADREVCFEEEELREKRIKEYIDSKLKELLTQYEIEISIDPSTLKGVGKWQRKQQ